MKIVCVLINDVDLKKQLNIIKKYEKNIYAVEIRADTFYPETEKISFLLKFINIKFPKLKKILTFRHFSEGGKIKITENQRKNFIISLLSNNFSYIDYVDIEFNSKIKEEIINYIKKYKKAVVLSIHYLNKLISLRNFKQDLKNIAKYIKNKGINKYTIKVVLKIDYLKQYFNFLKETYSFNKTNLTFFTVGKTSLVSRAIGVVLDMPLVYVATKSPVIASQPDISKLLKVLKSIGYNL
mgnify:CR=1 FL=1